MSRCANVKAVQSREDLFHKKRRAHNSAEAKSGDAVRFREREQMDECVSPIGLLKNSVRRSVWDKITIGLINDKSEIVVPREIQKVIQ